MTANSTEESSTGPDGGFGYDRDWTKGSIVGNLLRLSWPMVVSNTLMMAGPTIDMIWVGKLGSAAIAAVGVGGMAVQLIMGAMMGMVTGMRAMIARSIGASDSMGASRVSQQAFAIAAAFTILAAVVGIFLSEWIMGLFGLKEEVIALGASYLRVMCIGGAAMSFRIMTEGIMQAAGDTVTPMVIALIYRAIHTALCPFLIFGWWIFPQLGVNGAALTNIVSQSLGALMGLWGVLKGRSVSFNLRAWRVRTALPGSGTDDPVMPAVPAGGIIGLKPARFRVMLRGFRLDPGIIWRIIRIGVPSMVCVAQQPFSQMIVMVFIAPFGTAAVAAHTIVQRVEMFLVMPAMSFGNSAGVLVGQNLGAGQPRRAERSGWLSVGIVFAILAVLSLGVLLSADGIIRIFNQEPEVVAVAGTFLRIATVGFILLPLNIVFMGVLSGAGDTLPPMIASLISIWAVQMPLAYFLPDVGALGVNGIRWAMVLGLLVGGIAYVLYFRLGRWKSKRVSMSEGRLNR